MGSVQFVKNRCTTLINEGKIVEAIDLAGENTFRNEIEKLAKNKLEEYIQHSTMCPFEVMTLANMR